MDIVKIDVGDSIRELLKFFKRRASASRYLRDAGKINAIADDLIRTDLNLDFCFLAMAHNNGARQRQGPRYKYRSIIGGAYRWEWLSNFKYSNYQFVPIDIDMDALLQNIREKKQYDVEQSKIGSARLRATYAFEKVHFTRFFFLKENRDEMFYLVVGTTLEGERFESHQHHQALMVAVDKIRKIIGDY